MQYQKPIDLWGKGVQEGILSGRIKIQCGQWVHCGNPQHLSRYVGHHLKRYKGHIASGTFDVVHWQGTSRVTTERFTQRCESARASAAWEHSQRNFIAK